MGIPLSSNFDVNAGIPLESKTVKADTTARDAIPAIERYEGLVVYVIATLTNYQLQGGILNANWVAISGADMLDSDEVGWVNYEGTPQANEVAVFVDANTIRGNNGESYANLSLTWDGATLDLGEAVDYGAASVRTNRVEANAGDHVYITPELWLAGDLKFMNSGTQSISMGGNIGTTPKASSITMTYQFACGTYIRTYDAVALSGWGPCISKFTIDYFRNSSYGVGDGGIVINSDDTGDNPIWMGHSTGSSGIWSSLPTGFILRKTTLTLDVELLTKASSTTLSGLNVPHGTAPASPVNGDMWTTSAGLYVRINGGTVGPLGAGSGNVTLSGSTDNQVCTVTGANAIQGEANLTFNGSQLGITGTVLATSTMTATDFILSSDERLKTLIAPYKPEDLKINYKNYELISEPGIKRFGVIAQELQKDYPELVREGSDGMLSVSYIDLLIREMAMLKKKVKMYEDIFESE